jgi:hypothetical protein
VYAYVCVEMQNICLGIKISFKKMSSFTVETGMQNTKFCPKFLGLQVDLYLEVKTDARIV